jgi:homoserine dehydrogenase
VEKAKNLGYTEPNPWDDLNGLDIARKLIILARYAGFEVDINDVKVNPLIDEKY